METFKEINKEIIELSQQIREKSPELTKYLEELTVSIPDEEKINLKSLSEYRDTLKNMLQKYKKGNE